MLPGGLGTLNIELLNSVHGGLNSSSCERVKFLICR